MPKRRKNADDDSSNGRNTKLSKKDPETNNTEDEQQGSGNASAIPIFLKKTYRMIETCDPEVCSWTSDGEMFVVKSPELFASDVIPQYFDHNKFSSFARQLNFYGFRKIQTKPIRNEDYDKSTAKHVTFFNEKFKRDRYDLLKDIQRSTRGGGAQATLADQAREVDLLRSTVVALETRVQELESSWQELSMKMSREIQAKVELSMMSLLRQHQPHQQSSLQAIQAAQYMGMPSHPIVPTSSGQAAILQAERSFGSTGRNPHPHGGWGNPLLGPQAARAFSVASVNSQGGSIAEASTPSGNAATLPPHPKQKSLPPLPLPSSHAANPSLLLRNAWEDKFYSTLMMNEGASRAASLTGNPLLGPSSMGMGMGGGNVSGLAALAAAQQMQNQNNNAGYVAYMQDRAQRQRGVSAGRNSGAEAASNRGSTSLERQTTAEILLEAAGELGKNSQGKGGK